jgi:hypothetical protein
MMKLAEKKADPSTQEEWLKYRKGVRFVMAKLHEENDALKAQNALLLKEVLKIKVAFK